MKKIITIILICFTIFFAGCSQTIEEIKTTENVGKTVSVKGEVLGSVKILTLSGYTIEDENGDSIAVFSEELPETGDKITAKGTLVKKPIIGYYIEE
jgi:hypothetical protein